MSVFIMHFRPHQLMCVFRATTGNGDKTNHHLFFLSLFPIIIVVNPFRSDSAVCHLPVRLVNRIRRYGKYDHTLKIMQK